MLLEPGYVLGEINSEDAKQQVMYYQMVMECLAASCRHGSGVILLKRLEASGLLSCFSSNCYPMLHMLLEICRMVGACDGSAHVQSVLEQLGWIALAPVARVLAKGSGRLNA
eukprot:gnl/TRDRNA2_/TRDRNA2_66373_c0_seq1.p1 gnl/TRDRNA2_/TRDRNA2_66373_c0~~gnl/TRDRNA2_/TRDRNA2_66373_c0_seq1.p1  ORF type:complete len:112 (+),score=24.68 gnl/TRDRNA2_/TRDRNA2_66373_c0_seq1:224-559(+)